ncbi:MAG TPA: putative porin [Chitinophagaceae bacterium]
MLKSPFLYKPVLVLMLLLTAAVVNGQRGLPGLGGRQLPRLGGGGGGGGDSLQRRDQHADSITIVFNYLDSTRINRFDSSIREYYDRFPIPYTYHYLGNAGTAARPILFRPQGHAGWDPGFHAYDVYRFNLQGARFFNTTRPYTELGYTLGSQSQQFIDLVHTQNFKPYWNASIQYRLITSPGFFLNQRTAHNSYRLTSWYQSPNKRYNNYVVVLGNKQEAAENGGIQTDKDYLSLPEYDRRFTIPVRIGNDVEYTTSPFSGGSDELFVGTRYGELNALLRQQYDFGRKDSLVTDSTVIPLFYPRVRFEHTINYSKQQFEFRDEAADSTYYATFYNDTTIRGSGRDTVGYLDKWRQLSNDFSIYQFPDAKNLQQFIKVGLQYQWLSGELKGGTETFYNLVAHGEYRNRTRNQKWDMEALGQLWWVGHNAGDYHALVSLRRLLSTKLGSLQVGFENTNRSPSFVYDQRSHFYIGAPASFNKENRTHFFGRVINPALKLQLGADYYLIGNYLYFENLYQPAQYGSLFNVLMVHASKTFRVARNLNWYSEASLQQKAGNAPVNIPLVFTRNRLAFEGNFYRNLHLSTGLEMRYHTPYRMDNYSPALGQFANQDSVRIANRPDISAFMHFRIRSFKAYARLENLNTVNFGPTGFGFDRHNFASPGYPYPGLVFRLSIFWSFVN